MCAARWDGSGHKWSAAARRLVHVGAWFIHSDQFYMLSYSILQCRTGPNVDADAHLAEPNHGGWPLHPHDSGHKHVHVGLDASMLVNMEGDNVQHTVRQECACRQGHLW